MVYHYPNIIYVFGPSFPAPYCIDRQYANRVISILEPRGGWFFCITSGGAQPNMAPRDALVGQATQFDQAQSEFTLDYTACGKTPIRKIQKTCGEKRSPSQNRTEDRGDPTP